MNETPKFQFRERMCSYLQHALDIASQKIEEQRQHSIKINQEITEIIQGEREGDLKKYVNHCYPLEYIIDIQYLWKHNDQLKAEMCEVVDKHLDGCLESYDYQERELHNEYIKYADKLRRGEYFIIESYSVFHNVGYILFNFEKEWVESK